MNITYRKGFAVFLAGFIIQSVMYMLLPFTEENVNIILCLAVAFVLFGDKPGAGMFFGFVFGLCQDIFYGMFAGPNAVSIFAAVLVAFCIKEFINIYSVWPVLITSIVSAFLYSTVYWCIFHFAGLPYGYVHAMKLSMVSIVFNIIVILAIYFVFRKKFVVHRKDRYYI